MDGGVWIKFMSTTDVDIYYNGNNRESKNNTPKHEDSKIVQHIVIDFVNKTFKSFKSAHEIWKRVDSGTPARMY